MELAITVDAMEPFVQDTYILEGDSPLALERLKCALLIHLNIILP